MTDSTDMLCDVETHPGESDEVMVVLKGQQRLWELENEKWGKMIAVVFAGHSHYACTVKTLWGQYKFKWFVPCVEVVLFKRF